MGLVMIVDAHTHVGVTWPDEGVRATVADAIAMMDRSGITRACTSASRLLRGDFHLGNRITGQAIDAYPDRLIGFVVATPVHAGESAAECDHYLGRAGFRGIKVHRSHNAVAYDDGRYDPIYAKGAEYGVPVLAHTFSRGEVCQLLGAAMRHPHVTFIVGHSGGYGWHECLADIAAVPNAVFDVCCSCADAGRIEAFVKAGGAERVVYGSDLPFLEASHCLAQIEAADLGEAEREMILAGNILRLVGE